MKTKPLDKLHSQLQTPIFTFRGSFLFNLISLFQANPLRKMLEWQITIDSSRGRETNAEIINYTYLQNKRLIYNLNKVIKRIMSNYKLLYYLR